MAGTKIIMLSLTKTHFSRPRVATRAKKDKFVEPAEAPGEGKRREPNFDENPGGIDPPKKEMNLIKRKIMEIFKIKEIDYKKFNKENKWAIRPGEKK